MFHVYKNLTTEMYLVEWNKFSSEQCKHANMLAAIIITSIVIRFIGHTIDKVLHFLTEKDKRLSEERRLRAKVKKPKVFQPGPQSQDDYFCIHVHGAKIECKADLGPDIVYHQSCSSESESVSSVAISTPSESQTSQMSQEEKLQAVREELAKINNGDYSGIDSKP